MKCDEHGGTNIVELLFTVGPGARYLRLSFCRATLLFRVFFLCVAMMVPPAVERMASKMPSRRSQQHSRCHAHLLSMHCARYYDAQRLLVRENRTSLIMYHLHTLPQPAGVSGATYLLFLNVARDLTLCWREYTLPMVELVLVVWFHVVVVAHAQTENLRVKTLGTIISLPRYLLCGVGHAWEPISRA